ncbi:MAG: hypothetical protein FWH23_07205 [Bacteroidales bacterium]|nr:hypothetical protein [Bacteroidales bacterium]
MGTLVNHLLAFLSILLVTGCASMKMNQLSQLSSNYSSIPETVKELDIPTYEEKQQFNGYPFLYWHFSKQKEKQLGLESAELANDSLIFRVWITNPIGKRGQPHGLIELKYDSSKWVANLYAMYVDFNTNNLSETIVKFEKMEITPKRNDWDFIVDSLYQLKFDILPTDESIPNYYKDNSGYSNNLPTFSFEYATKKQYRFYQYNYPARKSNEFWQAKNVLKILDLLDDEFTWDDLMGNSLDSLSKYVSYIDHQCTGIYYGWRIDAGVFVPLDNLKNTLGVSPHIGLYFGVPLTEKYRIDLGVSVFIPVNRKEMEYFLPNEALTGKPSFSGTMGIYASRADLLKNCWVIENRFGTGLGVFGTNIKKDKPKHEYAEWYSAETIFLSLGTGIRKGNLGLSLNYFFIPYNAFKKNFKTDFGSQYLTISTYFTF